MGKFSLNVFDDFFEAVLKLNTVEDCRNFFEDICTIKELQDISQRLEVATLLKQGCRYQEISKNTGASTATISRVSRCLNYGSGGYRFVLGDESNEESTGESDD